MSKSKKIIAFFGSPRKEGKTTKLVEQVIAGAKSAGAEVAVYYLNDEDVMGCQACYFCRKNEGCATKDKLQPIYQEIKEADGLVAGFPIYLNNICGQSKLFMDRLFPMIAADFSPRYPGKKIVTVYSQGQPDKNLYTSAIEANDSLMKDLFHWDLVDSILFYGDMDPQAVISQEMMDRAFEAGVKLVK